MPRRILRTNSSALDFGLAAATTNRATFTSSTAMSAANMTQFTYAFWTNLRSSGALGVGRLIDTTPFTLISAVSGSTLKFQADVLHSTTPASVTSTAKYSYNKWVRVLVTWSDTDLRPNIYIDGTLDNATGVDKVGTRGATGGTMTIGNRGALDRNLNGKLDEFTIWNRVLTAAEIAKDAQGLPPSTTGLLLYYKMDEGSGTSLTDSSGNGLTGTISGATYTTDVPFTNRTATARRSTSADIKSSLKTNGSSSSVSAALSVSGSAFGVALWVKIAPGGHSSGFPRLFEYSTGSNAGFRTILTTSTGRLAFGIGDGASFSTGGAAQPLITYSQWMHVVCNYTSGANQMFINGVAQAAGTATLSMPSSSFVLARQNGASDYMNAQFNNVILRSGSAFSASEINGMYLQNIVPSASTLVWKLEEGAGTIAYDTSGNNNNGTIAAGVYSWDTPSKRRWSANNHNYVYNGDFEYAPPTNVAQTSTGNMDGTVAGGGTNMFMWSMRSISGSTSAMFDSANARSGNYALKVSTTATSSRIFVYHNGSASSGAPDLTKGFVMQAEPNTTYTLSYWMKTNLISGSSTSGARVGVQKKSTAGSTNEEFTNGVAVVTTTPWTQYSFNFTTSATAGGFYHIAVPQINGQDGAGTLIMDAWFDDITIRKATPNIRPLIS